MESGIYCLHYITKYSWWEWNNGSRVLFCQCTPEFKTFGRDGIPFCWINWYQPKLKRHQPPISDNKVHEQLKSKVGKVKERGYIQSGYVEILIGYFSFPKGGQYVSMVYYGTASGFNDLVLVPNFGLPSVKTLLHGTLSTSWIVDLDIGDIF